MGRKRFRLIACSIFVREFSSAIAAAESAVDPEFLELGLHADPAALGALLQARIDEASADQPRDGSRWEAILLGYGLCGNATAGLRARGLPLVLPRAHDCCTLLLGSRREFLARFGDCLSAPWTSAGFLERGRDDLSGGGSFAVPRAETRRELAARYGEENADYLESVLAPPSGPLRFIELEETRGLGHSEELRERAAREGREYLPIAGSSRLLRGLLAGDWDPSDYLFVPPGAAIGAVWDHEVIVEAR